MGGAKSLTTAGRGPSPSRRDRAIKLWVIKTRAGADWVSINPTTHEVLAFGRRWPDQSHRGWWIIGKRDEVERRILEEGR